MLPDASSDIPAGLDARVLPPAPGATLGQKRAALCKAARGHVIIHVDDDDWYAPDYIERALTRLGHADVAALCEAPFYDCRAGRWWLYCGLDTWGIGASFVYRRWVPRLIPWSPHCHVGEDTDWWVRTGRAVRRRSVRPWDGSFIASIHDGNTCPRDTNRFYWRRWRAQPPGWFTCT